MPSLRSINISLVSQFDLLTIPEYGVTGTVGGHRGVNEVSDQVSTAFLPVTFPIVTAYVPTYPGSQFWLSYDVSPPHSSHALYYFRMSLNGSHIVSWGCGEEDTFKGKMMFRLCEPSRITYGVNAKKGVTKQRALNLAHEDGVITGKATPVAKAGNNESKVLEIAVFRAKCRQKVEAGLEGCVDSPIGVDHDSFRAIDDAK